LKYRQGNGLPYPKLKETRLNYKSGSWKSAWFKKKKRISFFRFVFISFVIECEKDSFMLPEIF